MPTYKREDSSIMKLNYKVKLVFAIFLGTSQIALSQTSSQSNLLGQINTITTAVPFLGISPEARAGGMGDIGVSTSADVNSIHWNPAKLAFNDKKSTSLII